MSVCFNYRMSMLRVAALAVLLAAPLAARAQDLASDFAGPTPNLRAEPRSLCTEALELSCRQDRKPQAPAPSMSGFIMKFSRLAGMFMGRVDAAQSQDFHFRFTLDIKSPPDSTDNHINLDNRAG